MTYRTRIYIAADWTGDYDAVEQLRKWNDSNYRSLSFIDAHDLTQSYDRSLPCSIKRSLSNRMDSSKIFVLIVGKKTKALTKGSCRNCCSYNSWTGSCARGRNIDYRSYIDYECKKALDTGIKIVVLYNYASVDRTKCPEILIYKGTHVAMCYLKDGKYYRDYAAVKSALEG